MVVCDIFEQREYLKHAGLEVSFGRLSTLSRDKDEDEDEDEDKTTTSLRWQTALFKLNGAVSAVGGIPIVSISPKARKVPTYGTRRYLVS